MRLDAARGDRNDRDRLLMEIYKRFKNHKPDDVLYSSQLAGHDSFDENDYSTIEYEAGMLALFMDKKWNRWGKYRARNFFFQEEEMIGIYNTIKIESSNMSHPS